MSKKKNEPPTFAFGIDGRIYMNAFELDGVDSLEDALHLLNDEPVLFVGVAITPSERRRLARHLGDGGSEAAGYIAGRRRWRK